MMGREKHVVEGESLGMPVPGGWPTRGPFQTLADALLRGGRRRDDEEAEPAIGDLSDAPKLGEHKEPDGA
jgi:hypothetical protein